MNLNSTASPSALYDNPIPGREFILSLFGQMKQTLNREQIAYALKLNNAAQKEALRRRLRAMERDGQLLFNQRKGYQIIDQTLLVQGVCRLHHDGFGFVKFSATEKDLFLPKNQLNHVLDGDEVQILLEPNNHKRAVHKLIKIIERRTTHITGIVHREGNEYLLTPNCSKMPHAIPIQSNSVTDACIGQYVNAQITHYPSFRQSLVVTVSEVLGKPNAAGIETKLALRRYGISETWPRALLKQASLLGDTVSESDKVDRVDYRTLPFVTIDGADAKDFDDAVYCEQMPLGEWRLLVAIADVSHYVTPGDALDLEAKQRGTSIYCPDQVIPMLPETLSNGLCSLNPLQDRLVLVCDMTINSKGKVLNATFNEGVIHSHARLTYDDAYAVVANPDSAKAKKVIANTADIAVHLNNLHILYSALIAARQQRGAIEFDAQEYGLKLNLEQKIESIEPIIRHDAHRMIEEFMLCANVATADFLKRHKIAGLFRIHSGPTQKKLNALRSLLLEKGLTLGGGDTPTTHDYNALLNSIGDRADASAIRTLLLRSQSQAEYSATNQGHFGLAYDAYAHFTSPIRRYPDLMTHRAIKAKIRHQQTSVLHKCLSVLRLDKVIHIPLSKKSYPYLGADINTLSSHCSIMSRQADDISREATSALKCQYMTQFIGQSFEATISGTAQYGFFIELDNTAIEGLVPESHFGQGDFLYDKTKQHWRAKTQCFSVGDAIKVILHSVDIRERKMQFTVAKAN
ncbi:ribonuclease R [Pseudoalteromonas tunicata]|jgi:ribonuclease R|uniref:Ribonuclease R n=1 Tax=Pseudoalteromonas tunicata D2 TaxID=87626 RepID=A4C3J2_9GAMM|nr:ribonuclease R [Pseudoalteromonas tunicata]ATC96594.1 ribonuclease R [Pseudoalteromonas tunicata]AXT32779.1 ribonuclease R [Pseudoalteromonas tunicata]EAR30124.1 cold-shock RNAse R [Pseudoalteromonas tunicata D2]